MDQLRKFLDLGRLHYEKLILVFALLGLAATVWILNEVRRSEVDKINRYLFGIDRSTNMALALVDMAHHLAAIKAAETPLDLDFSLPHNLFNPVAWQRQRNRELLKIETGREVGPSVMEYTAAKPLNFILAYDRVTGSGYTLIVIRENAENPRQRGKLRVPAALNVTNEFFTLLEAKGDPKQPTELVVQLAGKTEPVTLAPDKPFTRVDGYEVELKYPPEGRTFSNVRVNSPLRFAGEDYQVVSITADEVVLLAASNNKKHPVPRKKP